MSRISISRKAAQWLEQYLFHAIPENRHYLELAAALKPKTRKPWATLKKDKAKKKRTKRDETAEIRAAVMKRADGRCEHCGTHFQRLELDHAFGRRGPQSERTCWALSPYCHKSKTNWTGGAAFWMAIFADHCERHGYEDEKSRALNRHAFVTARTEAAHV